MSQPGPWGRPAPPPRKTSRLGLYLWLGVMGGAALLIFVLNRYFPGPTPCWAIRRSMQTLGFLFLVSSGLLFVREFNLKKTARNILLWLAVGGVLLIGFSFQNELTDLGACGCAATWSRAIRCKPVRTK